MNDTTTIAAISTPMAKGGIGTVRLSGKDARDIAESVFKAKGEKKITSAEGYTAIYGTVFDENGNFDEAIALIFASPRSYTGEDVVEISCHGGLYILKRLLAAVIKNGAVLASAGEFTKRAFLNGKLSLTQAEAVMDMINAQSLSASKAAMSAHSGVLYKGLRKITDELISKSAHLAAWVDFPEEDIPEVEVGELQRAVDMSLAEISRLISSYEKARLVKNGVDTVIAGKPNAGKSSLMNLLAGTTKSIVTDIPGTTRDAVETEIMLGDVSLNIIDTAGIRETDDVVEQIGVTMAVDKISTAGLVLCVFDSSMPLSKEDYELIEKSKDSLRIAVINKSDLDCKIDMPFLEGEFSHIIYISARDVGAIEVLADKISQVLDLSGIDAMAPIIANERQLAQANRAKEALEEAKSALDLSLTLDAVNVSLDDAVDALLTLSGERASERIVDEVFSHFCVGK